jgi:hypothetical protein
MFISVNTQKVKKKKEKPRKEIIPFELKNPFLQKLMVEQSGSPSVDGDGKVLSENNFRDERGQSEVLTDNLAEGASPEVDVVKVNNNDESGFFVC